MSPLAREPLLSSFLGVRGHFFERRSAALEKGGDEDACA
jgi:hypothetical protein